MTTKPTLEEARKDLHDIRSELEAMWRINTDATWLSGRDDVDSSYYASIRLKTHNDILRGESVERSILKHYPQLL